MKFEDITVGMEESLIRTIDELMISEFSKISGDTNPIHTKNYQSASHKFKAQVAHGLISASFFSAIFGTKLPGHGCLYVSQSLNFIRPVYVNDTVTAIVIVTNIDQLKRRVFFDTFCKVDGKKVIAGSAELYMPK